MRSRGICFPTKCRRWRGSYVCAWKDQRLVIEFTCRDVKDLSVLVLLGGEEA